MKTCKSSPLCRTLIYTPPFTIILMATFELDVVCDLQMVNCDFEIKSAHDAFFHSFQDKLSPFLRFGCLSPRTVYHALSEVYQKVGGLD